MKKILCFLAFGFAWALSPAWAADGWPERFDPGRDAVADVRAAVALAKTQGKRVLVDVGGEWCPWCRLLDRFFDSHADVRRLRDEGYVWVKVNWSPQNRNEQLLSGWPGIRSYPHLFVLDEEGQVLQSQPTGELESGKDFDPGRVSAFLRQYRRP